jgi:hypothetical protein
VQQALGEVGGGRVAQGQDDDGVVRVGGGALGGEREAEERDVAVAPADLVTEAGTVPCGLRGQLARLGEGPADAAVPADDRGLVGDGEDGGETDAEAADRRFRGLAFGGGAERGEGLDTGRVEGSAGVGGEQDAVAEGEPEPSGYACPGRGVGGVLSELDDQTVPVAAEDQILLGVGVLTEPGRAGRPRVQHSAPQTSRPEGVRALGGRPHELTHVPSLSSSASR